MSNTDIKIKFNCNGSSIPAYSCSKSGDNSGVYVQSTDYDALIEQNKALRAALNDLLQGDDHEYLTKKALIRNARKALEQAK